MKEIFKDMLLAFLLLYSVSVTIAMAIEWNTQKVAYEVAVKQDKVNDQQMALIRELSAKLDTERRLRSVCGIPGDPTGHPGTKGPAGYSDVHGGLDLMLRKKSN